MNRRHFLKLSGTGAAALALPMSLLETGCAFSVKGVINVIENAAQSILAHFGSGSPWASELSAAIAALQQAEATWKTGGTAAIVIDALNTIEAVLAVIPLTAVYSPLIDLIISGVESIISYFAPTSMTFSRPRASAQKNVHLNRIPLDHPHAFQTYQGAFKEQFNKIADAIGLPQAAIK